MIAEFLVKFAGDPDAGARWLVGHAPVDENPDEVDTTTATTAWTRRRPRHDGR